MKNLLLLLVLFGNVSIKKSESDILKTNIQSEIKLKLPLGNLNSIKYKYKKKWKDKDIINNKPLTVSDDTEILKLLNFNDYFYKSLTFDKDKSKIIPVNYFKNVKITFNKNDKFLKSDPNFFIDSVSYYCGTLFKDKNYHIELYKDKANYNSKIGGDLCVTNYINLVCFDKHNKITDSLTILLNTTCISGPTERYFYIDKQLNIIIRDFDFNEDGYIYNLENKKYKFDYEGKFIENRMNLKKQ